MCLAYASSRTGFLAAGRLEFAVRAVLENRNAVQRPVGNVEQASRLLCVEQAFRLLLL